MLTRLICVGFSISLVFGYYFAIENTKSYEERSILITQNRIYTAKYNIKNDKPYIIHGEDLNNNIKIWEDILKVSSILPTKTFLSYFDTYTKDTEESIALVEDVDDNDNWRIGINIPKYNNLSNKNKTESLYHEMGHIITLNNNQVTPDEKDCHNYSTIKGCALDKSYINLFVKNFWTKEDVIKSKNGQVDTLYSKNLFVTDYAAESPEEDIAESFSRFLIYSKPKDSKKVSDQKILFFYQFKELVNMKSKVVQIK